MARNRLAVNELQNIIRLINEGYSQSEVARIFHISQSVVSRTVHRFRETGTTAYRHGGGREQKLNARQRRYVVPRARRFRTQNSNLINNALRAAADVQVSNLTIRRRLHENNLR